MLLEIIRRAAHDWILYRGHTRLQLRQVAEDAYIWLFEEKPGHPWHAMRTVEGSELTSFLSICSVLDLEPKFVRNAIKKLTVQQIMTAGRPAERRRPVVEDTNYAEHALTGISLEVLEKPSDEDSPYDNLSSLVSL